MQNDVKFLLPMMHGAGACLSQEIDLSCVPSHRAIVRYRLTPKVP